MANDNNLENSQEKATLLLSCKQAKNNSSSGFHSIHKAALYDLQRRLMKGKTCASDRNARLCYIFTFISHTFFPDSRNRGGGGLLSPAGFYSNGEAMAFVPTEAAVLPWPAFTRSSLGRSLCSWGSLTHSALAGPSLPDRLSCPC